MHHTMDGLEMLDPASSMTTLTPMSETPSITSPHHQLHGSYHGMNHMSYHHGGPLGGHTPGMNHYGKHFSCTCISELFLFHSFYIDPFQNIAHLNKLTFGNIFARKILNVLHSKMGVFFSFSLNRSSWTSELTSSRNGRCSSSSWSTS